MTNIERLEIALDQWSMLFDKLLGTDYAKYINYLGFNQVKIVLEDLKEVEKLYRVKPEFYHMWGPGVGDMTLLTCQDILACSKVWDVDFEDLFKQVEEAN